MGTDNKMTIMIVEDDQILAREIKAFLEQWGYTAGNVLRFDAVMDEFNRLHPQMILLDINLPYCDGFLLVQEDSGVLAGTDHLYQQPGG